MRCLSLALFYKDIDSFVQTSRETRPYNTSGLPDSLLTGTGALADRRLPRSTSRSTRPGGDLRRLELNYQQPFDVPAGLAGATSACMFNYTYVDSKIQYLTVDRRRLAEHRPDRPVEERLQRHAVLREREVQRARLGAYRDEYLTTVPGRNNNDVEGTAKTLDRRCLDLV